MRNPFQSVLRQTSLIHASIYTFNTLRHECMVQDFALPLVQLHEVPLSPLLQPIDLAAQPSGTPATPPSFVSSANLLKLHSPPETAWKAQICLLTEKDPNEEMNIPEEVLNAVTPLLWASKIPIRVKNVIPVKTELQPGAQSVRKKQHRIKLEAQKGSKPVISSFLEHGLTPSSVYLWMSRARPSSPLNGRIQLQDERHNPAGLPFPKDSRTALPCLVTYEACLEAIISLLNFLDLAGYPVSKKKAQIGKKKKRSNIWGLKSPKDREN
ncbi:hypothetical protein QYF61_004085 [Mycteria americana]|uniref:Uncharacterized protein n=1 Tax=Mycteria americana TaxID=33587 RepID=A0AAN7S213_MYCAM|nr:hypothetical protein QYF61_004085 [Mycteria americana]